jgi:hypothetical protein
VLASGPLRVLTTYFSTRYRRVWEMRLPLRRTEDSIKTVYISDFDCYRVRLCSGTVFTKPLPRNGPWDHVKFNLIVRNDFCNPILFAICTSKFSKSCKKCERIKT